jgi:tripartite-type tricarboxylate transporter receptor subunit TctC
MKRACAASYVLGALLAIVTAIVFPAQAASYPEKPISVLVGATAGGPTDIIARVTADGLSKRLGQPVVVVNRPGANSAIAFNAFVRSPPDGYTLYVMTALTASLPLMQQGFTGEPVESVEPVALLAMNSIAILARGNAPFNTLPELLSYARASPDRLTYATVGGLPELLARYMFQKEKVTATHVPYKGAADITNDLVAQRIDVGFYSLVGIGGFLADGRMKVIATTGKTRSAARPNVPTIAETLPGLELEDINYFGLVAPKGTPPDVIAKLHDALVQVGQTEDFKSRIVGLESTPAISSPAEFRSLLNSIGQWKTMAREVGFAPK